VEYILKPDEVRFRTGRLVSSQQEWLSKHDNKKIRKMRKFLQALGHLQGRCGHARHELYEDKAICSDCGSAIPGETNEEEKRDNPPADNPARPDSI
jgi:hypothetical protein